MEVAKTLPVAEMPLDFLLSMMRDPNFDLKLRLEAAKTAAQYCHLKKGDGGIKDEKAEKAKKVATGKFASAPAPLSVVK
jgi:phage terminase small subunit